MMKRVVKYGVVALVLIFLSSQAQIADDVETDDDWFALSLSPFLSYTRFNDDSDQRHSIGFGSGIHYYLTKEWSISSSILFHLGSESARGTSLSNVTDYTLGLTYYTGLDENQFHYIFESGILGDINDFRGNIMPYFGVGARLVLGPQLASVGRLRISEDISAQFGLEFPIAYPFEIVEEEDVFDEQSVTMVLEESSNGFFEVPNVVYNFLMEKPYMDDVSSHWAKLAIDRVTRFEVMSVENGEFRPEDGLPERDVSRMVLLATYLNKLLAKERADISYEIEGEPGVPYYVDMMVINSEGFVLRNLLSREQHYDGRYTIEWDGMDDQGLAVPAGQYDIHFVVNDGVRDIYHYVAAIQAVSFFEVSYDLGTQTLQFDDVIDVDWGETVLLGGVKHSLLEDGVEGLEAFGRPNPISKIEFIIAISKGLMILGAEAEAPADLTFYKDYQDIPSYAVNYLDVYIDALGYGGVRYASTLEPNKILTRAEAAEILNRLLNWSPDFESDARRYVQ